MKIDFFHWNYQCPINNEIIELLKNYENICEINIQDISERFDIAEKMNMYFPFLTVIDDSIRWRGPLTQDLLERLLRGEIIEETPYQVKLGTEEYKGEIAELNSSSVNLLSEGCTMNNCAKSCIKKGEFLDLTENEYFGVLNLNNGKIVGGVEYMPSLQVPYDIPKAEKTAFLTCIYHSSDKYDFKAYPLRVLEEKLAEKYDEIIAITDEIGTFPNGNLEWFIRQGYSDAGVISEEKNYCKLHLVNKTLIGVGK